jgi:hypothetical protein
MVFDRALPILKRVGRFVVRGGKSAGRRELERHVSAMVRVQC